MILRFPAFTLLFVYPGQYVMFHQSLAELSRVETDLQGDEIDTNVTTGKKELLAPETGQVYFDNVKFSSLATSYSKSDLVENSVGSAEKSIQKQNLNRVLGTALFGFYQDSYCVITKVTKVIIFTKVFNLLLQIMLMLN